MTVDGDGSTAHTALGDRADDNVLSQIHLLSARIGSAFYGPLEQRHGITIAEWRVLLTLHHHPGFSAVEITNMWAMEKMSVSRTIRRMEKAGWVARIKNAEDRRSYRLTLTDAGRRMFDDVLPTANARYREIVACLSRDELAELRRSLSKLIDHAGSLPDV
jgi:DNA-binding MarR family transcriptional regulator